jgi:putative ABC transport system ATP-binding protein
MAGAYIRDGASLTRARVLLDRVGLGGKWRQRPYQLSVGERQRVAVVRALVHRPDMVFADEPTAALDQATGQQVIGLLAGFSREDGGSVVVVTHDPAMLSDADTVLHLRDGRLN